MAERQVRENMLNRVLSPWESAPAAGIWGAWKINWNFSRLSMMMQCLAKKVWIYYCKPLMDYYIKSLAAWLGASKLSLIPTTPMALHVFLRNTDNFSLSTHRFRWPSTSSPEDKEMNVGFRRWSRYTIWNTVFDVINVYLSCLISNHLGFCLATLSTIHCFFVCIFYLVPLCVIFLLYQGLFLLFFVWEMPTNQPSVVEISGTLYYTCHHMLLGHDLYISSNYTFHIFVAQLSWYISNMYSHISLPD